MNVLKKQIAGLVRNRRKKKLTKHLSSSIGKRIGFLLSILLGLISINTVAMVTFENMSFADGLWLSLTTITTVGYGDFSPQTLPGRLVTIISLYAFAISVLTLLISEIVEWRFIINDKKRRGFWVWKNMQNHIQIINSPNDDTERYLTRLITEINKTELLNSHLIKLLSRKFSDGLPEGLTQLKLLHRTGAAEDSEMLKSLNLENADYILLLARDAHDTLSDSATFDVLSQIKSMNIRARIVAEVVNEQNNQRFKEAGAEVVIRPIRAYPELLVRSMVHPGTEQIIENLVSVTGDSLYREDVCFKDKTWIDVVTKAMTCGVGTPIAFVENGEIKMSPEPHQVCSGEGLILMSKQESIKKSRNLSDLLS